MKPIRMNPSNEYSVPELDETKAKADKSLVGTYWKVSRFIDRVGYLHHVGNLDFPEVYKEEDKILLEVFKEGLLWTVPNQETRETAAKNILKAHTSRGLPRPTYQANGRLVNRKRQLEGDEARWRRMWFIDVESEYPYQDDIVIQLTGTKRKLTGKWYASDGGYDSYTGDYDYEPGGLAPANHQTLFTADLLIQSNGGEWFCHRENVLIHPNDLIQEVSLT